MKPISASVIRNVEFRERLRGYHQGDVDEFLEEVAAAVESLEDQLQRADQRPVEPAAAEADVADAAVADEPPLEVPPEEQFPTADDSFRRTFELAQRAVDLAVQEANEHGAAIVASAEDEARTLVTEAQERARALSEAAQAHIKAEVVRLEAARDELRSDVDRLTRLVDQARSRAQAWLGHVVAAVDRPIDPGAVAAEPEDEPQAGTPPPAEAWDQ